jgi:hypothetical protein
MAMGSTHDITATARRRRVATTATAIAALAALGLTACTGDDDDAASSITQSGEAAMPAMAPSTTIPAAALADSDNRSAAEAATAPAGGSIGTLPMQVIGQDIAITARATVQTADVEAAVTDVTRTVTANGGHLASADIDYGHAPSETPATTVPGEDPGSGARATLVIAIPPGALGAVRQTLDDVGDVQSFVQQGEDVTDQLTDLETRITNHRASVARIRELYATATDVEAIVRIEGELTNRETALEQLLALQASTQARVAMSTLTIDITETAAAAATTDDGDGGGTTIGDALGAGWSAFAGAVFATALVLTAAMPFLVLTAGIGLIVWLVLRRVRRERAPLAVSAATPEPADHEDAAASRPG